LFKDLEAKSHKYTNIEHRAYIKCGDKLLLISVTSHYKTHRTYGKVISSFWRLKGDTISRLAAQLLFEAYPSQEFRKCKLLAPNQSISTT